jgi:hypothetical protein
LEFYELLCGFTFAGSKGNGVFLGVDIEGQDAPTLLTGYNVINGILFEGAGTGFDTAEQPITGSFVVTDSTFRSVDSATPSSNVQNSSILISRNTERDVGIGGELNGLLNSRYEYSFNTVQASTVYDPVYEVAIYDGDKPVGNTASSEILIAHNTFILQSSTPGTVSAAIGISSTFSGGSRCQILSNNFQEVNVLGIYLGPGTSHCVVAGNIAATIQNLGADNVIIDKSASTPQIRR